jgi:hypothetical protein
MTGSFDPEEVTLLASVFDRACKELKIRDEARETLVACRIVRLADQGERDPEKLLTYAMRMDPIAA